MTVADSSAVIHYTTNGTSPSESDPIVASGGTVAVNQSLTLKARAWKPGAVASEVTTAMYELKAVLPAIAPGSGGYATGQNVTMSTSTTGATLRYTVDGGDPTASSTVYSAAVAVASTGTVRARAFKAGWTPSDAAATSYWISAGAVATPTINPSGGTQQQFTLVTLASATPEATIRYTVDGTDPSETSPVYRNALLLSASTTLKTRAFRPGYVASSVATATLTVDPPGSATALRFTPSQGVFETRTDISVAVPSGSVAHYTVNGDEPSLIDPAVPSGGVTVQHSQIVRARAWESGTPSSNEEHAAFAVTGAIGVGLHHTLVLKADGALWGWGSNSVGQIGDGTNQPRNTPVQAMTGVAWIAAGRYHSFAVKRDGTVWALGSNGYGQFCNDTITGSLVPIQITQLTDVVALAGGFSHTLALKRDGTVWACGDNAYGQLGDGTTTARRTPVQVIGLRGVRDISAGTGFSLAVQDDGGDGGIAWAWGTNIKGQLGDGTSQFRSIPVRVLGLDRVVQVAAGESFGLARLTDDTVRAWGANTDGQLGNGTTVDSPLPIAVTPLVRIRRIAAGEQHGLAVDRDGHVWTWGNNDSQQVGLLSAWHGGVRFVTPQRLSHAPPAFAVGGGRSHSVVLGVDGLIWVTGGGFAVQPLSVGSTMPGISTGNHSVLAGDQDEDGVPTWRELTHGTDPLDGDSDGNGLGDYVDLARASGDANVDDDGDGAANVLELARGTDPFVADTDGDGVADGADAFPLDSSRTSTPTPDPSDTTPPVITLTQPTTARPRPPIN